MPILILVIVGYFACVNFFGDTKKEEQRQVSSSYTSYDGSVSKKQTCEMENPYSHGTGHFAGYRWAKENSVSSCGGNSTSFVEGCQEYLEQESHCK